MKVKEKERSSILFEIVFFWKFFSRKSEKSLKSDCVLVSGLHGVRVRINWLCWLIADSSYQGFCSVFWGFIIVFSTCPVVDDVCFLGSYFQDPLFTYQKKDVDPISPKAPETGEKKTHHVQETLLFAAKPKASSLRPICADEVVLDSVERIVLHINSAERIKEETFLLALRRGALVLGGRSISHGLVLVCFVFEGVLRSSLLWVWGCWSRGEVPKENYYTIIKFIVPDNQWIPLGCRLFEVFFFFF